MIKNKVLESICDSIRNGTHFKLSRELKVQSDKVIAEMLSITYVSDPTNVTSSKSSINANHSTQSCEESKLVILESISPKNRVVIFGGGHVGQVVSLIAAFLGFDVEVIDDRIDIITRTRFPDPRIRLSLIDLTSEINEFMVNSNTSVVIVTRGHQHDEEYLRQVLQSSALYIGMIGSKRRVYSIFHRLEKDGFAKQELRRVHAPIGLKIGAKSPQEIGLAIMAEVISHREGYCMKGDCPTKRS
jgi:xanthine dehydrogenase accessory factor